MEFSELFPDVFLSGNFISDPTVLCAQKELASQGSRWIWKNGRGGFDEFLKTLNPMRLSQIREHGTLDKLSVFALDAEAALMMMIVSYPRGLLR